MLIFINYDEWKFKSSIKEKTMNKKENCSSISLSQIEIDKKNRYKKTHEANLRTNTFKNSK